MRVVLDRPISAENPDKPGVSIPPAEPVAVDLSVFGSEDFGTNTAALVPLIPPRRQKADVEAKRVGLLGDPVDVCEILFIRLCRIVVGERPFAVRVRRIEAVELREGHSLNNSELQLRA